MRISLFVAVMLLAGILTAQCPTLLWADEFNGNSLNQDDWNYQTGDGCDLGICDWGNNELQWYARENVTVENGLLKIRARQERVGTKSYSSGRITTKDKRDFRYGYYEARIKVPPGGGLWPAFWMLPTDEVYGGWPRSGEIDIMEWIGNEPQKLFGTLHYGQPWPNNASTGDEILLREGAWSDGFHTYAVEWKANEIHWYVDGYRYGTKRPGNLSPERWPFDQDFHFLLNLAIGGNFGGSLSSGAIPATMEVDYLRVYDAAPPSIRGPRELDGDAAGAAYVVDRLPEGATISWTVPEGAVITDNSAPNAIVVDFGSTGGLVSATIQSDCEDRTLSVAVFVVPALTLEYSLENFDQEALAVYASSDGTLMEVNNPAPNDVNRSSRVGRYVRNGGSQFDVLVYDVSTIENAADYLEEGKAFSIDIYTQAAPGTEILLQLETAAALPTNYPTGRHSRFRAATEKRGEWHRLTFEHLDRPDRGVSGRAIRKMALFFKSNSLTSDVYHFDNLDSYGLSTNSLSGARKLDIPLHLAPNPTNDRTILYFTLPRADTVSVRLLDGRGAAVRQWPATSGLAGDNQQAVDLSGLPAGVYFLQLKIAGAVKTVRVVKR